MTVSRIAPTALCIAAVLLGCGHASQTPAPQEPVRSAALAGLAGQPVVVLPAQYLRADTIGWSGQIANQHAYLAALDSSITMAIRGKGLGDSWRYAEDMQRAAARNPTVASDPHTLAAEGLRPGARRLNERLGEPLASQVRGLIALSEARLVLLPVEVRFERAGPAGGRGILRVAVLDGRLSTVRWLGDVVSDTVPAYSPALATTLATRLANMIVPPQ